VARFEVCFVVRFGVLNKVSPNPGAQTHPHTSQVGGVPEKGRVALHLPQEKFSVIGIVSMGTYRESGERVNVRRKQFGREIPACYPVSTASLGAESFPIVISAYPRQRRTLRGTERVTPVGRIIVFPFSGESSLVMVPIMSSLAAFPSNPRVM
jgi:hypothetical protein